MNEIRHTSIDYHNFSEIHYAFPNEYYRLIQTIYMIYLFLRKSQHASLTDCKCRKLAPTNSDWTLLESISTLPLYAKFTNASRALKYINSNTIRCNFPTFFPS